MDFVAYTQNPGLTAAALAVALAAGFTGLTLTKELSRRPLLHKKVSIALAALALGGGIWSMHFVAMLGLQMPFPFHYDAAITLASALLAILMVGAALILLHFVPRTPRTVAAAGAIVAAGILSMHYLGMAGLERCRAVYTLPGLLAAGGTALGSCVLAFSVAYGRRTDRNILLGTLCFGLAVVSVHFMAIAGTRFAAAAPTREIGPAIGHETMALGVILTSFVLLGAFLWTGVTYLVPGREAAAPERPMPSRAAPSPAAAVAVGPAPAAAPPIVAAPQPADPPARPAPGPRVPCEKDGATRFIELAQIAFLRAEGHYTQVYAEGRTHYCAWTITEAARRLQPQGFLKVHRSYLVNPAHVVGFERRKDNGLCRFSDERLPPAPVSRSNLKAVREALG